MNVPPNPGVPSKRVKPKRKPRKPVHRKVLAATAGAGGAGVFGTFVLWVVGVLFWSVPADAAHADAALAAVPAPVSALLLVLASSVSAFVAGYFASSED